MGAPEEFIARMMREAEEEAAAPKPNGRAVAGKPDLVLIRYSDMVSRLTGRPLVRGLLEREQISVVRGEAGSGKTFMTLDLGLHVAAGLL